MPCVLCCHVTIVCTVCRVFTLTQQYPPYLSVSVEQSLSQTNDCQSQNPYTCPKKKIYNIGPTNTFQKICHRNLGHSNCTILKELKKINQP